MHAYASVVECWSIQSFDMPHLMPMSHSTLGQLLTTVDQVSSEYWLGCGLSTNQGVDRQSIADAVSMI